MLVFYCMKCNPKKKKWVYIRRPRDFDGPSEALKRAIIDTERKTEVSNSASEPADLSTAEADQHVPCSVLQRSAADPSG
jgi:hypothetical protein